VPAGSARRETCDLKKWLPQARRNLGILSAEEGKMPDVPSVLDIAKADRRSVRVARRMSGGILARGASADAVHCGTYGRYISLAELLYEQIPA